MANTIITKNSATATAVPTAGQLVQGELAVNVTDKRLFTENSGGTVVEVGTNPSTIAVAGNATVGGTLGVTGLATLASSTLTANPTLSAGTANGVTYLNGSKVLTSGSALTFDGAKLESSGGGSAGQLWLNSNVSGLAARVLLGESVAKARYTMGWLSDTSTAYLGTEGNFPLYFQINGSEQMRLTSTGLGIGTSSPAVKLEIGGTNPTINVGATNTASGAALSYNTAGNYFSINAVTQGVGYRNIILANDGGSVGIGTSSPAHKIQVVGTTDPVGIYSSNATAYQRFFGSTTTASPYLGADGNNFVVGSWGIAERMRIDSAGNVGIGTSSASYRLHVAAAGNSIGGYFYTPSGQSGIRIETAANDKAVVEFYTNGNRNWAIGPGQTTAGAFEFKDVTASATRMLIDSSGNLLVGTTSAYTSDGYIHVPVAGSAKGAWVSNTGTSSARLHMRFENPNGVVGSISTSGSATAYNTSSDYRLKEDWVAVANASTRVNALKPVNFAWIANGARVDGFLAHELAEVVPEAVTGEKDAVELVDIKDEDGNVTGQEERPVYQGIDQSKLVPLLTAALQEALAQIEEQKTALDVLTARVSVLEGN